MDDGRLAAHDVYVRGDGPPILILQELPGIGAATFRLAQVFLDRGYSVYLPELLGPIGSDGMMQAAKNMVRMCIAREFHVFAAGRQSPIAGWMRGLCHAIKDRSGGQRLGVIGMCLTGSFAIPLMAEDPVIGAVAGHPSLPFFRFGAPHVNLRDAARDEAVIAAKGGALALRYKGDLIAGACKVRRLAAAYGSAVECRTYRRKPGIAPQHSLLGGNLNAQAVADVVAYFDARFGRDCGDGPERESSGP